MRRAASQRQSCRKPFVLFGLLTWYVAVQSRLKALAHVR